MFESGPIILKGSSFKLESLQEVHRNLLKPLITDGISKYAPGLTLQFDRWFDKAVKATHDQVVFVVKNIKEDTVIGSTRLYDIKSPHKKLALGYTWYSPEYWGTAVNPECKYLLLQYAFEKLNVNRVEFNVDSRNARSCAALKKLGATEEGVLRKHVILEDGFVRDTVVYSILKGEWPVISENLLNRINK